MGLNYFASSPVLLPPPSRNHYLMAQQHDGGAVLEPSPAAFQQQSSFPARKFVPKYPRPPSLNYQARTSLGVAGRKRSREDVNDDEHERDLDVSSRRDTLEPASASVYGPGMTMITGQRNLSIAPESQSGTWMEEVELTNPKPQSITPPTRPQAIACKSQRRLSDGSSSLPNNHEEIDPIVMQLGIGWKRPAESQASAMAGSETFIRNQFPLSKARILLHHEGLGIYVVRTEPAGAKGYWHQWWLFREDLKSCRFLCNDDNDLFRRLSHKRADVRGNWIPDILVEGPEVFAKDTPPSPITALSPINGVMVAKNVEEMQAQQPSPSEDVAMDLV